MFEIGWTEMLVIAIVMIVVVGPKDLPKMLRTFGKTAAKMRAMAGDFQKQFNEALKEAELDDVKKSVDTLRSLNPTAEIRKQLNPFEKAAADVRAGLDAAMKPKPSTSSEPASAVTHEAEPVKNGATDMPGVAGPDATLAEAPAFPPMADPIVAASTAAAPLFDASIPPPVAPLAKVNGAAVAAKPAKKPVASAAKPKTVAAAKSSKAPAKAAKAAPVAKSATAKAKPVSAKAKAASAKKPVDSAP